MTIQYTKIAMKLAILGVLVAIPTLYSIPSETIVYEASTDAHEVSEPQPKDEEEPPKPEKPPVANTYKSLHPEMVSVCACESRGNPNVEPTHYDTDGTVLRGRINSQDIGMCQINLHYHEETAQSMGLDVFVEADNIAYANYLYETQGFAPWSWSKPCHGKG